MKKLIAVIAVFTLLLSCTDDSVVPNLANLDGQENLIGIWEYDSYEQLTDSTYTEVYRKVNKIAKDQAGITFKNSGVFLSKQNAGWCGKSSYKMEVLELTNNRLKVRPFDQEYEQTF